MFGFFVMTSACARALRSAFYGIEDICQISQMIDSARPEKPRSRIRRADPA
jgi:hypothetical protein